MSRNDSPFVTLQMPLGQVPDVWLRYVEPRIERPKGTTCWIWQGACDTNCEPVISYYNLLTKKRNTRRVKMIVAELFWKLKKWHEVVHLCGSEACLNPQHFYISHKHYSQEDREGMKKIFKPRTRARNGD